MSVSVMSLIWDRAPFEGGSLLVMLALADWSNDNGVCWPSVPTIAHKARMKERNARYILKELQANGWVEVEEHRGRNHSNVYYLNLQKLQALPKRENLQAVQVSEEQNLQSATLKPAICDTKPAIAVAPEPSLEPSREPSVEAGAAAPPPQQPHTTPAPDIPDPLQHPAVLEYIRVMDPKPALTIHQCTQIASKVTNMAVWKRVLTIFAGNDYRGKDRSGRYAGNALDRYESEVAKLPPGSQQPARAAPQQPPETPQQKQARLARVAQERAQKQGQQQRGMR